MRFRGTGLIVFGLALSSCSAIGIDGSTRQFSGVWLYEFEGSTFVEGATSTPAQRPSYREAAWLDFQADEPRLRQQVEHVGYDSNRECYTVQPFRISFMGHRTFRPFGAGHMSLWRSQMTVERMISVERLGPAFCYGNEVPPAPAADPGPLRP